MSGDLAERDVTCPHCWEPHGLFVDTSAGSATYVEDCSVCCHPMEIAIQMHGDDIVSVQVSAQ